MDANTEVAMIGMLSASLALVRPVGMTAGETQDWINVALDAVCHLPFEIFERGIRSARQTCTHHSQIVPTVIADTREALAWYNRPKAPPALRIVGPAEPVEPRPKEPLPDPNTLMPTLRRMGLQRGWIIERDGRLEWSEESAA